MLQKNGPRLATDAPTENDDTSNSFHDSNFSCDTVSTASTEVIKPTDQIDEAIQNEKFPSGGNYKLRRNFKPNLSDPYR